MIRILIADDHTIVRQGLRTVLQGRAGWTVCGEATTGREAVTMARQLNPNIVVLDFSMPELNGLEATHQIREALPQTEVLLLTMHDSEALIHKALAAGAKGFILKSDAGDMLVSAVEQLCQHKPFFTSKVSDLLLSDYLNPSASGKAEEKAGDRLTAREREIVQLIAEAKSTKEIAETLDVAFKTVDTHRTNLMHKLKIHSVSELVRYAIRNQIIEP